MGVETNLQPDVYRVADRRQETQDTITLYLEPEEGNPMQIAPGQFNMLYAFGIGEAPISVSGIDKDSGRIAHSIKRVGKVTQALCGMDVGDCVGVRGPYGRGWPMELLRDRDPFIIAGGIGLAPLRPVLEQAIQAKESRSALIYGARRPQDQLYVGDLDAWKTQLDGLMHATVDAADVSWTGNVGVVTGFIRPVIKKLRNAVAFICGPEIMMRLCVAELLRHGLKPDAIYLSMERNMQCAVGHCGRCQFVGDFVCKDGPVFSLSQLQRFLGTREV